MCDAFLCACGRNASSDPPSGHSVSLPEGSVPPLPARHHAPVVATSSANSGSSALEHNLSQLIGEGFDVVYARRALKLAKNNIELAREILNEFVPSSSSFPLSSSR